MFKIEQAQGAQALDYNILVNLFEGNCVKSSRDLEPNSGTGLLEIAISSGEFYLHGEAIEFDGGTVELEEGGDGDRKDVIYVTSGGSLSVEEGVEEPRDPSDREGFETFRPSPTDFTDVNGLVICEVIVEEGAEYVTEEAILDRRFTRNEMAAVTSKIVTNSLTISELGGDIIQESGAPPISRIDGPNLKVNDYGELEAPATDADALLEDHDHSGTEHGGDTLRPRVVGTTDDPAEQVVTDELDAESASIEELNSNIFIAEPGDTQSIHDALENANDVAGTVIVPAGKYEQAEPFVVGEGVDLILSQSAEIVKTSHEYIAMLQNVEIGGSVSDYDGPGDITIEGGVWDGDGLDSDETAGGFHFGCGENITIRNATIRDMNFSHHLEFNSCRNVRMQNLNLVDLVERSGDSWNELIQIEPAQDGTGDFSTSGDTLSEDVLIESCYFENSYDENDGPVAGVGDHSGNDEIGVRHVRVVDCEFRDLEAGVRPFEFDDVIVNACQFVDVDTPVESDVGEGDVWTFSSTNDGAQLHDADGSQQEIGGVHFAAEYSGTSPDERLDNALNAATEGDKIVLENAEYEDNRTISFGPGGITIEGTGNIAYGGSVVEGEWQTDGGRNYLKNISFEEGLTLGDSTRQSVRECAIGGGASIVIQENRCRVTDCFGTDDEDVVFESGTSGGLVDSCVRFDVVDDGDNTVGDIS